LTSIKSPFQLYGLHKSSSVEKLQESHLQTDQNPQKPDCTGTKPILLFIPNQPLSRQGKSLDNTLVSTLLTVLMAHHIFAMYERKYQIVRSFWTAPTSPSGALSRAPSTPKMTPFSRVESYNGITTQNIVI
jgi:hypothetical protein